jgi:hypothetical protein
MKVFRVLRRILLTIVAVVAVDALTRSRKKASDEPEVSRTDQTRRL